MKSVRLQLLVLAIAVATSGGFFLLRGLPPGMSLECAVEMCHMDRMRQCFAWGRRPDNGVQDLDPANSALWDGGIVHVAARAGHEGVMRLLLDIGVGVHPKDESGRTPLVTALCWGHTDIAEMLLAQGADIETGNEFGRRTSLHEVVEALCCRSGVNHVPTYGVPHLEDAAEFLIARRVDVNARDDGGNTPLHYVAGAAGFFHSENTVPDKWYPVSEVYRKRITLLLLLAGADTSIRNDEDKTSLDLAQDVGFGELVSIMEAERSQWPQTLQDLEAVDYAELAYSDDWYVDEVKELEDILKLGGDLNTPDSDGRTFLHRAARGGNLPVIKFLIEHGVDVNTLSTYGVPPIFEAAKTPNEDVVRYMIEAGADLGPDCDGFTPHDMAIQRGNFWVAKLIRQHQKKNPQ